MAEWEVERRLAAIVAADVVGYSRLMEADESGTLAQLKALRKELINPKIAEYRGRIVKTTGDGILLEYASVTDAVQCSVDIQEAMAQRNASVPNDRRIQFRFGINLGEIIIEDGDIYGNGVNVAARLEAMAEPDGICISGSVYDQTQSILSMVYEDLGEQSVKNISAPVRIFAMRMGETKEQTPPAAQSAAPAAEPARATIAVLPFDNLSADPEQEYFADGLAEDLITDLSNVPGLFVISRHSAFAYKGKSIDIRSVAKDLGVRFVVEGSVRRAAARIRINVQLIDAEDGTHLWADRFDRDLADIFVLQDEVVGRIVNALADLLPSAQAIARQRTTNLEAYDLIVRGRVLVTQSLESNRAARPLLERSIELDPSFADAHAWLAMSHLCSWAYWGEAMEPGRSLALAAAQRAVSLDPENASAHAILGYVLLFGGKPDAGAAELATALGINPNHADAWAFLGELKAFEGNAVEGIEHFRKAFRLNPYPPGWYYWLLGLVEYAAGQYETAVETLRHESTHRLGSQRILAASLAQLGRMEEAKAEAAQFLAAHPHFSIQHWGNTQPFQREADRQHFIDGYLKAGLPM
jgi:TolB-like protein/Tfp pilus assembly protein PilF